MPKHLKNLSSKLFTKLKKAQHNGMHWGMHWILRTIYRKEVHITPAQAALVKAAAVFWYNEEGFRKFIMVRNNAKNTAKTVFPACYSSGAEKPISDVLYNKISSTLGTAFTRSLDMHLLEVDRVAAVPTLSAVQTETGPTQVQAVIWLIQITKEQAELCMSGDNTVDILNIPEFALLTEAVDPIHKVIYQSIRRKLTREKANFYMDSENQKNTFHYTPQSTKMVH